MDVRWIIALAVAGLVQGCTTEPVRTEADFGNSVRQMIAVQKIDAPPVNRPSSYDGRQAEKVLQAWRSDVAKGQDLKTDVSVSLVK